MRSTIGSILNASFMMCIGLAGLAACKPIAEPPPAAERRLNAMISTQTAIDHASYSFRHDGGFRHPESGLQGRIDEEGRLTLGRERAAALALSSWGRRGDRVELQSATPALDLNVAVLDRGPLRETLIHGPLSLLHQIDIFEPRDGEGELVLSFALDELRAEDPGLRTPSAVLVDRAGRRLYHLGEIYARDARGRMLPVSLAALDEQVGIRLADSDAAYPVSIYSVFFLYDWHRVATLDPFLLERPNYGASVDISAVWAAVSSPGTAVDMWNQLAYLFGDIWERTQSLGPDQNLLGQFGAEVSFGGGRLAIGAPWSDPNGVDLGYVHVYGLDPSFGNWVHETTLTPSSVPMQGNTNEFGFGRSLDMDGSVLVVGANRWWGGRGLTFIFERTANVWSQVSVLSGDPVQADANFGDSVHVSGDNIAITQPGAGIMVDLPGRVFVYRRIAGVWTLEDTLAPNDGGMTPDDFGGGAALDGDWLVARGADEMRAYQRIGNTWNQTWTAPQLEQVVRNSLSMDGTLFTSGSQAADAGPISFAGEAELYRRQGDGSFVLIRTLQPPTPIMNGNFGASSGTDNARVIIGEPGSEQAHIYRRRSGLVPLP